MKQWKLTWGFQEMWECYISLNICPKPICSPSLLLSNTQQKFVPLLLCLRMFLRENVLTLVIQMHFEKIFISLTCCPCFHGSKICFFFLEQHSRNALSTWHPSWMTQCVSQTSEEMTTHGIAENDAEVLLSNFFFILVYMELIEHVHGGCSSVK